MNAPVLIAKSQDARVAARVEAELVAAIQAVTELGGSIRYGDLYRPGQSDINRSEIVRIVRDLDEKWLKHREAIAQLAGDASTDVSEPDGLENALIGALERHFTVGSDAPARTHEELGITARYAGGLR